MIGRSSDVELYRMLRDAQDELVRRMAVAVGRSGGETFTYAQMQATLQQIRLLMIQLQDGMFGALRSQAGTAATMAAQNTVTFLSATNRAFEGMGVQPLVIDEAAMFSRAVSGAESSILRRIGSNALDSRRVGILRRYGLNTVSFFEKRLQLGLLQKKRFEQIQNDLIEESPFLQSHPRQWAERIFRTEGMAAYNKGSHESFLAVDDGRETFVKIIVAHFDDRTYADSYSTHGQIRRLHEPFDTWRGPIMHPPDRPNDRGSMILHRKQWPLPPYLKWKTDEQVLARWRWEGRKGSPPPRPLMTTVLLEEFGRR